MQTVLIVDDIAANLYYLEALLKGNGFGVRCATNGAEALESARTEPPDLIVSDILMPVMDGYALCKVWRSDDRLKAIPFIFYTATFVEKKDEALALGLGADCFVIKPQEPESLMGTIRQVLADCSGKNSCAETGDDEGELLKEYNEALFRKLEKKMSELELAHQELELAHMELQQKMVDQKRLEEQLRQVQKMEAIGRFSAGIAHDLNNILTVIVGFGTVIQMKMASGDPQRDKIDHVLAAADRAANLTRSLLTFSRKQEMSLHPVDLKCCIRNVETFLCRIIGQDIKLELILSEQDTTVLADGGQMEQVLMNLATNARDAMPKGGTLTIATESAELDDQFIQMHGFGIPGRYVLLTIADNGSGMDHTICQRIFEPFFTTKESGRGTGLGLSIIYGIITQHNGYIHVYSEPGRGTTFKILLPLMAAAASSTGEVPVHQPLQGGSETILVVDDEAPIRKYLELFLKTLGYNVLVAEDGREAVMVFSERRDEVDLVLMDMIMPNMSAKEAALEMRDIRSDINILYTSGYPYDLAHEGSMLERGAQLLVKPVSPTELAQKLRRALNGREG